MSMSLNLDLVFVFVFVIVFLGMFDISPPPEYVDSETWEAVRTDEESCLW